jgi:hypothetical protein
MRRFREPKRGGPSTKNAFVANLASPGNLVAESAVDAAIRPKWQFLEQTLFNPNAILRYFTNHKSQISTRHFPECGHETRHAGSIPRIPLFPFLTFALRSLTNS